MRTDISRSTRLARVALAAIVMSASAAIATPAAAQDLASTVVRPAPMAVTTRTVAVYRFDAIRGEGLPAEVTLVDRGGQLTATYRLPGQRDAQPMMVTLLDADIILQAETAKGVLTLQLYGQNDAPGNAPVTGRWTLDHQSGALRGRTK